VRPLAGFEVVDVNFLVAAAVGAGLMALWSEASSSFWFVERGDIAVARMMKLERPRPMVGKLRSQTLFS
jgi:hypothetical protein